MDNRVRWTSADIPQIVDAWCQVTNSGTFLKSHLIAANAALPPRLQRTEASLASSFYKIPRASILVELEEAVAVRQRERAKARKAQGAALEVAAIKDEAIAQGSTIRRLIEVQSEQANQASNTMLRALATALDNVCANVSTLVDRIQRLETRLSTLDNEFTTYLDSVTAPNPESFSEKAYVPDYALRIMVLGPKGVQMDKIREGFDNVWFAFGSVSDVQKIMNVSHRWEIIQMTAFTAHSARSVREKFAKWTYVDGGVSSVRSTIQARLRTLEPQAS